VATEAVAVLERMGDGGCRIESELRAEVGQVFVGPAQLQQIVLNLLLNAREAVPVGGSISVHTEERNIEAEQASAHQRVGRWVVITVRDSGPGMDEATQARIFEPFFTTKRSGQGAGLGLSTVYGLVTQAGGWIDVRSGRGQGTTVSVHLPRLAEKAAQVESEPQHEQSARGETVLVCDDETRLATLTAGLLDQYGYGAVTAANVEEAVSALHAAEPACDVVLLDVNFPEGSALAMLEQMDQCGDRQPVILTSGYAEDDVPDELMSHANVVGYLAKPYSVDRLVGMMRRALGRRTSQL
jgi:two-component system cell cycle sensor histidine kinase/response regulator CckA